ncbi:MAG: septum formation inhibitor Maf [Rhodocyclaceae bacterium]|nr:septum formation inhibitor Maf [Rhodocyclaceae bacterium]MBP7080987.1 septum formation inhibitor Maf [Rhodocyclaceae bacterium]
MPRLVLASTSPFRRELLSKLQIPFETATPDCDETPISGELPHETAERLSAEKAASIADSYPASLIIGSDQVAQCELKVFGKPGTNAAAAMQLRSMRGKEITFHTGLCLLNTSTQTVQRTEIRTLVGFRNVSDDEIRRYLEREDARNCAGSAKAEGLGISLIEYIRGDDPNALIGLPLIALCQMLRNEGVIVP